MKRRAISLITILALCLSLCPAGALAADYTADPGPSRRRALAGDTTEPATYDVTDSLRFDTDGHSYTVSGQTAMSVKNGARLYLTTGSIRSMNGAGIEVLSGGFLRADEADMTVTGTTYGLDIASGTTVWLFGGTFTGGTAAIHVEDGDYAALLPSTDDTRYAFFDEGGAPIPLFDADGNQLTSTEVAEKTTVTVQECTDHSYVYAADTNSPTHNGACRYCGVNVTDVLCTFHFDENGHGECAYCEHTLDITVDPDRAVYDGGEKPDSDPVTVILDGDENKKLDGGPDSDHPDYTVKYTRIVDVGKTVITVEGVTYHGKFTKTFSVIQDQPVITWDPSALESYDYSVDKDTLISQMRADLLDAVKITGEFTRRDLTGELKGSLEFSYKKDRDTDFTPGLPTDAGTYTIKARLPGTQNYAEASGEVTLTVNKIDPIIKAPVALELTYNGGAQKLVTPGEVRDGAVILFATSADGPWSTDIPTATDAGSYEVWYKVEETKNYNAVDAADIEVEIQRKEITPVVELEYSTTVYDGGFKEPKVTVRDPDTWVELLPSEYKVTYASNQYVGTATVTVTDVDAVTDTDTDADPNAETAETEQTGNYTIRPVEANFQITPKDQNALTITGQKSTVTYGDVFILGTTGGSGSGTVKWEIVPYKGADEDQNESGEAAEQAEETTDPAEIAVIDEDSGEVTVIGVGKVTVRATKSGTDYATATAEWTFTAVPKRVTAKVTAENKTYDGDNTTTVHAEVERGDLAFPADVITITWQADPGPADTDLTVRFRDGAGAGTNKIVVVNGEKAIIEVPKDSLGNEKYIVTIPGTTTADIYKAEIKVTAPTSKEPTYNGEKQALVNAASAAPKDETLTESLTVEYSRYENGPWDTAIPQGTNAGDYEVWYRVEESGNYLGAAAKKLVVTIDPKTVTVDDESENFTLTPAAGDPYYEYDGSAKTPAVTIKDGDNDIPATEYTVTYSNNVSAGTAAVIITDNAGGNYKVSGTVTFTITSAGADLTGTPQAVPNLEYNGQPQDLVTVGTAAGGSLEYALANQYYEDEDDTPIPDTFGTIPPAETDYKAEIPRGKYAGTYAVYYRVKGDGNHGGSASTPSVVYVTIRPKTVTSPDIRLKLPENGFVYDGNDKTFKQDNADETQNEIAVYDDTKQLIPQSEYTVSYSNNRSAGTATVHINDVTGGNYDVSGSITFKIGKAPAGWLVTNPDTASATEHKPTARAGLVYNGKAQALITAGIPDGGTAVYARAKAGPYSTELPTGTDVGTYEVWAMVRGDENHEDSDPREIKIIGDDNAEAAITIAPGTMKDVDLSSTEFRYNGSERKPTVTVKDDRGNVVAASEYTVEYLSFDPTKQGESEGPADPAEPAPAADTVNAGGYYVVITSKKINYGEFTKAVRVEITEADQTAITITGTRAQVYYGDKIELGITGGTGDGTVEWKVEKITVNDDGTTATTADTTNKITGGLLTVNEISKEGESFIVTVTRTPTSENYKEATATWTFTVQKKPITVTVTAEDRPYNGEQEVTLIFNWDPNDLVGDDTGDNIDTSDVKGKIDDPNASAVKKAVTITGRVNDPKYAVTILGTPITVTISKARAAIETKPEAKTDLVYQEDSSEPLIFEGSTKDNIGEVVYALEKSVETSDEGYFDEDDYEDLDPDPPGLEYTSKVPTLADVDKAGEYTIWYKVVPTDNWTGTEPESVTVTIADPSDRSNTGSTGGGSGDYEELDDPPVSPGDGPGIEEIASIQTTVRDGTASTVVNGAAGDELVNEAIASRSKNVVIRPEITGDVTRTEVSIPASTAGRLGSETDAALTVSTPVANVIIPNGSLGTLSDAGGSIGIATERVENTVVLTLTADGQELGDIPGGLTLTVPMEDAGPGTVAVVIHEDGTRETVRWSVATDGAVRIPLNGSVTVEIVDNSKDFADVPSGSWAADAVAFASAHEIFAGTGESAFSPNLTMSRAMLATMLYILEGRPEQELTDGFSDVDNGAWYAAGVSWAAANGIAGGDGDGQFGPNDSMTREELAVMFWRYAGSPAVEEQAVLFLDADQASGDAMDALCWAAASGLMCGDGAGHLNPTGLTTRAQAAQMLKNYMENT